MSYTAVINGNTYIYEEELNDTSSRATAVGKYFGGDLINISDIDWFSVTLPANTLIKVNFVAGNGQYGRWSTQYFDSKLNLVGASNFSISGLAGITSAETTFTTSSAGIYYFKIQAYDAGSFKSSSYWIGLDYVSPPIISAANSEISIKEGNTENPKVPVTLIFDKPSAFVTAIHFTVRSGTANVGTLYGSDVIGSTGGTLIVEAGSTKVTLPNTLIWSDTNPESDEYFWVDFDAISIGNAKFANDSSTLSVKVVIKDDDSPANSLASSSPTVNEGSTVTFTLTTTNFAAGTYVPYIISGVSGADVPGGLLSGTALINTNGTATISVSIINDFLTEGIETLTVTAGGASASTVVNDTSKSIVTSTEKHTLSVLVDKGVLGPKPILLIGLNETMTFSNSILVSHIVQYAGILFNFDQIDSLITTITRDGEFTSEFSKEINDFVQSEANITYKVAVELVGVQNIESTIIAVAGSDGNYVS